MKIGYLAAVGLLITATIPLRAGAQEPEPLPAGKHSISVAVPSGGGGQIGYWRMIGDRTNLGFRVGFTAQGTQQSASTFPDAQNGTTRWDLTLAPAVKHYVENFGPVQPFLFGSVFAGVGGLSADPSPQTRDEWNAGTSVGLGAEWFPVASLSIGAYTGVRFAYNNSEQSNGTQAITDSAWQVSTLTSQITLHIYFGGSSEETGPALSRN